MQRDYSSLEQKAKKLRLDTLNLAAERNEGHIGGAFSSMELFTALFGTEPARYNGILTPDDQFILSKGHSCLPYFLLLREKGYDPHISGHPTMDKSNGIPITTGSLGIGLPTARGMAFARKRLDKPGNVYVIVSDGECQEGTTWETLMAAAHDKLDNLVAIVDYNNMQTLGTVDEIMSLGDLTAKITAFGCNTYNIDGHSFSDILNILPPRENTGKPHAVIARTIKGKGVSFMENDPAYHTRIPTKENLEKARRELS